jgi:hypothetical protein
MAKKKVFAARNLKDCLPNLPLKTGEAKKKIKVFLSRQFCVSLSIGGGSENLSVWIQGFCGFDFNQNLGERIKSHLVIAVSL